MTSIFSRNMETLIKAKHKVSEILLKYSQRLKSKVFRQGPDFLLPKLRVDASSKTVYSQAQVQKAATPRVHCCAHHRLCHLGGVAPPPGQAEAEVGGAQYPDTPHHRGKPGAPLHQT